VDTDEDLAKIEAKGGVMEDALQACGEQKAVRCHRQSPRARRSRPAGQGDRPQRFRLCAVPAQRCAVGHQPWRFQAAASGRADHCFESVVLPIALREKNGHSRHEGVCVKANCWAKARPRPTRNAAALRAELPVSCAVLGMITPAIIAQDAAWARSFTPMTPEEMQALSRSPGPGEHKVVFDRFFAHHSDFC
jgi:hypothetical protein